jgi:hypothetical protein
MLRELRGAAILGGARGRAAVDRDELSAILVRLGTILEERPDIIEIDINPVIATPTSAVAVDALVVVAEERS